MQLNGLRFWISLLALALLPGMAIPSHAITSIAELENYRGVTITEIQTAGNRVTKDYVIAREIWSEEGHPLDPALVAEDITRLENLALFGSVVVTVIPQDNGVALNFEFTEMPSLIPFPAVSWNEQNGFSFGVGLTSPNFRGRGVNLSTKAVFGGTTNYFFRASNPWIAGDHLSVELLAYHSERDNTLLDFEENSDRVEVTLGYYIGRYGRMSGNIGYWGVGSDRDGITLSADRRDDLFLAGMKLGFDNRDSWRVPHSGWELELVSSYLGGDANTQTNTLDIRRYQPVADRHTIALGPLFSMQSGVVGTHIPSYQQYFLGGSNSVRGFKLEELGKEIFGRNRLLFTAEYRYLIMPVRAFSVLKWAVAVGMEVAAFSDVGVIWNDAPEFGLDRTRLGYGVGARVLFPVVDMLRFDVGISEFGDVVFNFGVHSIFRARSLPVF
jgi:outer membrane protein insertion porin family